MVHVTSTFEHIDDDTLTLCGELDQDDKKTYSSQESEKRAYVDDYVETLSGGR